MTKTFAKLFVPLLIVCMLCASCQQSETVFTSISWDQFTPTPIDCDYNYLMQPGGSFILLFTGVHPGNCSGSYDHCTARLLGDDVAIDCTHLTVTPVDYHKSEDYTDICIGVLVSLDELGTYNVNTLELTVPTDDGDQVYTYAYSNRKFEVVENIGRS